jgi:hypothetical protein
MVKLITLVLLIWATTNIKAEIECNENALKAALALHAVNVNGAALKIVDHQYLGKIMILTGYLQKYQTALRGSGSSEIVYYQTYLNAQTCWVQEIQSL